MLIIDQALVLLEQNYVNLPLKTAMHAVDPVARLRVLRRRTEDGSETYAPVVAFHAEMLDVFTSVRDLHTNYVLPDPFRGKLAFLPFLVEEYYEGPEGARVRRYAVSKVARGFEVPDLIVEASKLLRDVPRGWLTLNAAPSGGDLVVTAEVEGIDRLDVYVDGRPRASVDAAGGAVSVTVAGAAGAAGVRVEGFVRAEADGADLLVAARQETLRP